MNYYKIGGRVHFQQHLPPAAADILCLDYVGETPIQLLLPAFLFLFCWVPMASPPLKGTREVMMPNANLCFSCCRSRRPFTRAQHLMRTSCKPCSAAGRRIITCCAHTQPWLLTITTHIWTAGKDLHGDRCAGQLCQGTRASLSSLLLCLLLGADIKRFLAFLFSIPRCCLAPASAAKFQDAVLQAGLVPKIPPEITALTAMETRSTVLQQGEDWARVLWDHITAVEQRWGKGGAALTSPGLQGVNGKA